MALPSPNRRALALISGGLDSALSMRLMLDQGIELLAVHFVNPFDDPSVSEGGRAQKIAAMLGVPFKLVDKGPAFIDVLRHPRHGYGSGMNPCIDCRIYTFRLAREMMEAEGASFVVSGEVLGQRPMSQMRPQLDQIEKRSDLEGLLLRPLCAKRLDLTIPELDGRVNRDLLEEITGRGRSRQLELARHYGLVGITSGAGGCLLTDKAYATKLRDLYAHSEALSGPDFRLLNIGRHFRLSPSCKVILSRDEAETEKLRAYLTPTRRFYEPLSFAGPSALVEGPLDEALTAALFDVIFAYSKPKPEELALPFQSFTLHMADRASVEVEVAWREVAKESVAAWKLV